MGLLAAAFLSLACPALAAAPTRDTVPILRYQLVLDDQRDWDCLVSTASCAGAGTSAPAPAPLPEQAGETCTRFPDDIPPAPTTAARPAPQSVSPAAFEGQMRLLKEKGYRSLTLDEFFIQRVPLTGKDLVLTFDGGYADNYAVAMPILGKYGLKADLFMAADDVGRPGRLTVEQLREMAGKGFQVHSLGKTGTSFAWLSRRQQCLELYASKLELSSRLGRLVGFVSYPFGDHAPGTTDELAFQAGYDAAFSLEPGLCGRGPRRQFVRCPRFAVSDSQPGSFSRAIKPAAKKPVRPAPPPAQAPAPKAPAAVELSIETDRSIYTPLMSATVGVGLTPVLAGSEGQEPVFHWRASFGRFLAWGPPDYEVVDLGADIRHGPEKIYWSFDPDDLSPRGKEVRISVTAEKPQTGARLAEAQRILLWKDAKTVTVPPSDKD